MKFKTKNVDKIDEIRIRKFFTWMPLKIDGETRWLEIVIIKEKCCRINYNSYFYDNTFCTKNMWIPIEFIK